MNDYTQLTLRERRQIYAYLEMNFTVAKIAEKLNRHKATIYREIARNKEMGKYYPGIAQQKAKKRKTQERLCKIDCNIGLRNHVIDRLQDGWSPEQISGRMRHVGNSFYVCSETIYRYVYRAKNKDLYYYLPYKKPHREIRFSRKKRICRYGDLRLITQRPQEVETRETFGHWEGDSIVFSSNRKQSVATVIERKTRYVKLFKNWKIDAKTVMGNMGNYFVQLSKKAFSSITFDQGSEFAEPRQLELITGCKVFYCEIRSPWQKGSNENMNGRIRRFLPRNANIDLVTQEQLNFLTSILNDTPRKCLGFQTPKELYLQHCKNYKKIVL
jgi:IS30 family transposase